MINPDYFNQIFKVSPMPGVVLFPDAALKVLEVNKAYLEATGIPEIILLGNSLPAVLKDKLDINIDSVDALRDSIAIAIGKGVPHKMQLISFNFYNKESDNFEIKYYQPENNPLFKDNKVEYIFHTLTDVTEKVLEFQSGQELAENDAIASISTLQKTANNHDSHSHPTNRKVALPDSLTEVFTNAEKIYNTKVNYETLINGTEDLMWSIDRNLCMMTANRAYLEKATLINVKMPGDEYLVLTGDSNVDTKAWRTFYQRGLDGETFTFKENIHNPVNLTKEYTQFTFCPILNREDQIMGVACYGKNLTEDTQSLLTLETVWAELNKVMDYSPDVICTINSDGKFANVSAASEKLWGYTKESMVGRAYDELLVKEDVKAAKQAARKIISGRVLTNIENNCIRKDGTLVPVIWSAKWDEAEKMMYCVAKDGTEKKKAELEMSLLIRNTDESFILLDKELKIVDFNIRFKTLYENLLKHEVKKGNSILDYALPERRPNLQKLYKNVLEGNEESNEISFRLNEESTKFYFIKYKPALNENGDIIGVFVTGKDNTEVVMARQQIENSEKKYRLLFHKSPIPKWVYDLDTLEILDVNETAISLYGYTREEFLSMTVNDLKPAEDSPKMADIRENIKRQEGLIHFGIFTQIKKDKSRIKADVSGHKLSFMKRECMMIESNDVTEKESVLQKFKENEVKLLSAQKIARLGYWQKTFDPESLFWSDEVYSIWGVSSDSFNLTYASFFQAIHPDDKEAFSIEQAAAFAGERDLDHEHRIILPDGSVKWVHEKGKLVKDESGKSIASEGTVQDITDNKLAHEKLLLSEARYKGIVESQTNYVTRTDLGGKYTYVNHKFTNDFSWVYPEHRMIGNDSLLSVCEHHRSRLVKTIEKCFAQLNKVFQAEIDKPRKGGGMITTLWDFICLSDSSGKPTEIQCVGIDISDRKKAEEALKESNTRYEYVLKATSDAIWDWDLETNVIYHGDGFKALFGYETKKTLNGFDSLAKNLHPDDQDGVITNLTTTLEGNETHWAYEYRYLKSDGSFACVMDKALIIRDARGKAQKMVGAMADITERKTLQELLDKSNRLARIGSWEIDVLKGTVYWSSITKEIREADPDFEPDLNMGMHYFKEGNDRDIIKMRVKECIDHGTPWDEDLQILTQKGNLKWIRTIGEAEIVNGKCLKVYGSFQDIDDKKRADIQVMRLYEEKNTILESIGDGFFTVDKNWVVTYWNQQAEKMLLVPRGEVVSKQLWDVFPESTESASYKNYFKAFNTKKIVHFEDFYGAPGRWYEISAYPSNNGLSVYFKDISDRKKAEEAIRLSTELYTMVSKATNDSVWDWDLKKNVVSRPGKTLESLFGYGSIAPEEVDSFWKTHVHPDDWKRITENRNLLLENPDENYWEDEYRFLKPDGKFAHVYDRAYIIRDDQKKAVRMIGASKDFSKLKENEIQLKGLNEKLQKWTRELSNSNAELEQFAYIASHDLQEPLRMITSFLILLEKKYGEALDEKGKQYIYYAVDGAKRMRQIILDLLEYSRLGRDAVMQEKVDLNEVVAEILVLYRKTIEEKKAVIKINKLPVITASTAPMRQVFQNLIGNALKYHNNIDGTPPEVSISCKSTKNQWAFAIKDNGIGIDAKYFEKIFIIFQRLYNKEEYSGTGMGLAIAKKIIESMGGKIWVVSEKEKGSTFFFTISKASAYHE